jgi:hypothetical protein
MRRLPTMAQSAKVGVFNVESSFGWRANTQ